MKYKNIIVLLFLLIIAGIYMLNSLPLIDIPHHDAGEESDRKHAWELSMLADPATGKIPEGVRLKELGFWHKMINNNQSNYKKTRAEAVWNSRGPWNVGGRTRGMAIDVSNENHLIAGAVSGGIWQSWDAGSSWTKVSDSNAHPGVVSISQDKRPGKTNIWYALSGEISGTSASGGGSFYLGDGAFLSIDNGNTWKPMASLANGKPNLFQYNYQGAWRIEASLVDTVPACVYIASYGTIYRSTDTGTSWAAVLGNGNFAYYTDVAVSSTGVVYATMSSGSNVKGFFRSDDGVHFTNITPASLKNYNRTVLEINPNNENEVYFLSHLPDSVGGITTSNYEGTKEYVSLYKYTFLSGDGSGVGGNWQNLSENLPVHSPYQFDRFNCQGGYDLLIKVQPGSNNIIIGGTNLYRSTDGFTSANNTKQIGGYGIATELANFTAYPNHHPDQHQLYFLKSNPQKAYSVSDGGVKFTENINAESVEWQDKSLGYITSQAYTVNIDESKPYDQWMLSGFQDNANFITNSNNFRNNWTLTVNGDGAYNYMAPNRQYLIVSTQLGNVRKVLIDQKGNVIRRMRIDPVGTNKDSYTFINPLLVSQNNLFLPVGKTIGIYKDIDKLEVVNSSSKLKTGWIYLNDTITTLSYVFRGDTIQPSITSIAISNTLPTILYIGTNNKELYRVVNPLSANARMQKCPTARLPVGSGAYVSDIKVDPDSAATVFMCYSNYGVTSLYYSSDTGNTWYMVGGNLESASNFSEADPSVRSVAILKNKDGKRTYFAGTSIGLYSTDTLVFGISNFSNKTVWKQEAVEKIGAGIVTDLKTRNADGYIAVATHGYGLFDSYYFTNQVPISFLNGSSLDIYPNPANNEINYTFANTEAGDVHAEIVNIMGQKVMTGIKEYFNTGTFTMKINISHLSSGHYFFNLYNGNKKPIVKHFVVSKF